MFVLLEFEALISECLICTPKLPTRINSAAVRIEISRVMITKVLEKFDLLLMDRKVTKENAP